MREMIEAAKLYERQTLAERRTATPRVRNGAIGQAGIQIIEFLARVIDYGTGALFPSLHTITEGTGLSKNCVVQALARLKAARILDWFRRYEPVPDAEAAGAGPRSEEHTSELQSLMRTSYAVFCLKNKKYIVKPHTPLTDSEIT